MENEKLQIQLEKTKTELLMLYEIGNAMMTTLKLDELLYVILTAVTAREGLGFNRAMLFLVNEGNNTIEGKMGIGPKSGEEAHHIWTDIESQQKTMDALIYSYHLWESQKNSPLNQTVKEIKLPLVEESGIIALTCLEAMPFEITTEVARSKLKDPVLDHLKAEFFVTVPLKTSNKAIGTILVDNLFSKKTIVKDDVKMLTMFANQAGLAIENSRLYEETLLLSNIDSLTRVWNHGRFQAILGDELVKAKEVHLPLSLIMLDVDYFKNYNDNLGHQAGDLALKSIARIIRNNLRAADPVGRYGGEEFIVVLPGMHKEQAFELAEKIRKSIEDHRFPNEEVQPQKSLTVSCGVAAFPKDTDVKERLIYLADSAMYKAKKEGRNRTCLT